jgi:hypothetical protein
MMKPVNSFAAAALLPLVALAQTPTPEQQPTEQPPQSEQPQSAPTQQSQGATFESLDTDGDGRISKTEAEANADVKAQFSGYDLNGDGFIERAEVNQANDAQPTTPRQ